MAKQIIFISATPDEYELQRSEGIVTEQVVRPTGLLDPPIEVRDTDYPVDDLMDEIQNTIQRGERILVTTLTKRMAEELSEYLLNSGVHTAYIHSDVDTLERVQIMEDLRKGIYDVLVGVNLLREGLDLPEVSLVAILDADKEGFLRSHRSLTQTAGRAARNVNGKVIMYAKHITQSMQKTIDETNRRRQIQMSYNSEHGITPKNAFKSTTNELAKKKEQYDILKSANQDNEPFVAAESIAEYITDNKPLEARIAEVEKQMKAAAKQMDFLTAAQLRDIMLELKAKLEESKA